MSRNLLIVESPAKAKTLEKFLGKGFRVLASYGHVRDIRSKKGMVDVEGEFEPRYATIPENKRHVDAIKKALKESDALYLATDPDREGEAISWHLPTGGSGGYDRCWHCHARGSRFAGGRGRCPGDALQARVAGCQR